MNFLRVSQSFAAAAGSVAKISGDVQKVALNAQSTAQKITLQPGAVLDKAAGAVNAASNIVQKTNDIVDKGVQTFEQAKSIKQTVSYNIAKTQVSHTLGTDKLSGIEAQKEILRQEMIDPQFSSAQNLFRRIKDIFVPTTFPSGKKVPLRKPQVNEISYNIQKKQPTKMSVTSSAGDEFVFNIKGKPVEIYHEPAFVASCKHKMPTGESETVKSIYFPQSGEIRSINIAADGSKVLTVVNGNEQGGIVKHIKK